MRKIVSLLLVSLLSVASLFSPISVAQNGQQPAARRARPGATTPAPEQDLSRIFKSYERVRLDTAATAKQVRQSGRLSISTGRKTFELELELHNMRAVNYTAEETIAPGVTVQLAPNPIRTYKGRVRGKKDTDARFTIDEENFEGSILTAGEQYYIEPARRYQPSAAPSEFLFYRASDVIETEGEACTVVSLHERVGEAAEALTDDKSISAAQTTGTVTPKALASPLEAEIATEADFEFVSAAGSSANANAEIETIMNQVEAIYQRDIGLFFKIVTQHTWATASDPYTTVDPVAALKELTNYWNTNFTTIRRDVVHMWTGKNLTNTSGVAWGGAGSGVVCKSPASAYGLSERRTIAPQKFVLPAHELGHNFGASHTDGVSGCANTIMQAIATDSSVLAFCPTSQNAIISHINANSSCLSAAPTCSFAISPTSASFPTSGGTGSIAVTASSGCTWTASTASTWITITAGSQGSGNGTVSYTVAANTTTTSRTGTINAAGKAFTVTQAAVTVCTYTISPTTASYPSGGGTGSIAVTTTAGCAWTAVSNAPWITVTAGALGSGNGTVNYTVAANTAITSRSGTITVAGKTFSVSQAAQACTFSITPTSASYSSTGGSGRISVTATAGCAWTARSNVAWITITAGASGTGSGAVSYTVAANTSPTARSGTLTVAGKTFTVSQSGAAPALSSLTLSASTVAGCKNVTGTVKITSAAPAGGLVVTLTDTLSAAVTPSSVTIPAGATSATFTITTTPVSASQSGTVTATRSGVSKSAALTVRAIGVQSVSVTPVTTVGGNTATGTVTLECAAAPGNITVTLSDNVAATSVPASVVVPAGQIKQTFSIPTTPVSTKQTGTLTATANGISKTFALGVRPIGVLSLTLSPNPVTGGNNSTGTVTLERPAAPGGIVVTLSSNNQSVANPTVSSITIPAGVKTGTFTVATHQVTTTTSVIITATANTVGKSATLTVNPGSEME